MPVYVRVADKAKHLRDLGMSHRAIVRALGVSDKTVANSPGDDRQATLLAELLSI